MAAKAGGATAYGAAGEDNGVRVSFSDKQGAGNGNTGFVKVVDASTGNSSTDISVVFGASQFSGAGAGTSITAGAVVVHEGSHVADDQAALFNATVFPGLPNPANITHAQSESQAYLTGAAFMAEHGGTQASPLLPGLLRLNTPAAIGVFLQTAPSGRPPYRAYPQELLQSPIY